MNLGLNNISVYSKSEKILQNVTCEINSGEILAIIGHQVSGKTTLLSTIVGREPVYEGEITLNGTAVEYSQLSTITSYVTADDLFLPTLTVRETLLYAYLLRQTPAGNHSQKTLKEKIDTVEILMELHDVANTPVQFLPSLTKKCLSIACELFHESSPFIAIDDGFQHLSFNDSRRLTGMLGQIACQLQKGVIISVESPCQHTVDICQHLLCLYEGKVSYMGSPDCLPEFLRTVGHTCPPHHTPVELLLTLLSGVGDVNNSQQAIVLQAERVCIGTNNHMLPGKRHDSSNNKTQTDIRESVLNGKCTEQTEIAIEREYLLKTKFPPMRNEYSTPFWHQLKLLTSRNFHNARRRILFPISVLQNVYILVICVLVWWRPPRTEATIKDRLGLFFFTVVQWAFFALLDAILTFPKELRVLQKERGYKLYRTSVLCISKTISEVPLAIIQPCVYMAIIYWVANLNGSIASFLGSIGVLTIDVIAAQSIGLFVGAALNPPWTVMVVSLGLLSMMLWGGAFCTPPLWLQWGQFASYFTYGLNAFVILEFKDAEPIQCANSSLVPVCNMIDPATNSTFTHFPSHVVLSAQGITWSVMDYVLVLVVIVMVMRMLWYFIIRVAR